MLVHPEVPAHVQHVDQQRNGIVVKGGTNWDLSRSAVATPIAPAVDPEPKKPGCNCGPNGAELTAYLPRHQMPSMAPDITVNFAQGSSTIRAADARALARIPKGATVVVAGHADVDEPNSKAVATSRASAVAASLKKSGKKVSVVKSFGADLPLVNDTALVERNRRVEVFVR